MHATANQQRESEIEESMQFLKSPILLEMSQIAQILWKITALMTLININDIKRDVNF